MKIRREGFKEGEAFIHNNLDLNQLRDLLYSAAAA
jgi:hypothetical protein